MPFPLNTSSSPDSRPHAWTDWYRFARDELGLGHDERVEYANLRFVEEQNRESLRRRSIEKPAPRRPQV
jgi:hypothetical protein